MKKFAFLFLFISSVILFSCASDSVEENNDDILDSPAAELADQEDLPSSHLVEPEDFEEPLVRDLEIPETQEIASNQETSVVKESKETENKEKREIKSEVSTTEVKDNKPLPVENTNKEEQKAKTETKEPAKAENTNAKLSETKKETVQAPKENKSPAAKNETPKKSSVNEVQENKNESPLVDISTETVTQANPIVETQPVKNLPSRSVSVNTNETLTVRYPGYGWIYLGSDNENNNLVSTGRKIENDETIYTLTAKKPGTQLHHFYKVDSLTGEYIDDFLEVTVQDNSGSVYTVVQAPDYKEIVPERPSTPAVASSKKTAVVSVSEDRVEVIPTEKRSFETYTAELTDDKEEPAPAPKTQVIKEEYIENLDADDLLKKAKDLFDEKKYVDSQKYLTSFMEIATKDRDEGLFLQGQIFEQDGKTKNIKEAINSYQSIVDNYPESYYWDDANKRIIYLNRFYIQIR